jgi:hypothetical protein
MENTRPDGYAWPRTANGPRPGAIGRVVLSTPVAHARTARRERHPYARQPSRLVALRAYGTAPRRRRPYGRTLATDRYTALLRVVVSRWLSSQASHPNLSLPFPFAVAFDLIFSPPPPVTLTVQGSVLFLTAKLDQEIRC